jgi:Tol biopolymer transport system component
MRSRLSRRALLVLLVAALAATAARLAAPGSAAHAAFPGRNGRIVFDRWLHGNADLWTTDLHGRLQRLTRTADSEYAPAWSPNGLLIVFLLTSSPARATGTSTQLL